MTSLTVRGWDTRVGCHAVPVSHVAVRNSTVDAHGAHTNPMYMTNVQYVTLSGLTIGNVRTGETEISNAASAPCPHNDHLTFEHTTWHDFLNPNGGSDHMECLQFDALKDGTSNDNVILRGNRFLNCGQYDVFISGPMKNWQVTNNFFDEALLEAGRHQLSRRGWRDQLLRANTPMSLGVSISSPRTRIRSSPSSTEPSPADCGNTTSTARFRTESIVVVRATGASTRISTVGVPSAPATRPPPEARGSCSSIRPQPAVRSASRTRVLIDRGAHVRLTFYRGRQEGRRGARPAAGQRPEQPGEPRLASTGQAPADARVPAR